MTTTKMFELPEDLKKISAGKIVDDKRAGARVDDHRGRGVQMDDQDAKMDK